MAIGDAPEDSDFFLPSGQTWNGMRRDATHSQRLTVAPPLAIQSTPAGPLLTLNAPTQIWVTAVVTGPVPDGGNGRYLAKIIDGPVDHAATGDFKAADLGITDDNQVVEAWCTANLEAGKPCAGWLISARGSDGNFRPILLVPGGGIPRPTRKYDVYTAIDDTMEPIWTTMRVQE